MDWDLAPVFLAVAGTGQPLRVDHATVSRRVNPFQARMGVRFLARRTHGCLLSAAGEVVPASADQVGSLRPSLT